MDGCEEGKNYSPKQGEVVTVAIPHISELTSEIKHEEDSREPFSDLDDGNDNKDQGLTKYL